MNSAEQKQQVIQSNWNNWKWQIQNRITTISQLSEHLILTTRETSHFTEAEIFFSFAATPYYLSLADRFDSDCPIRKQIVPSPEELNRTQFEKEDPLAEEIYMPVKGVTHRYPDRAIWYISHVCAVYCRFCTRKRKVSKSNNTPDHSEWELALEYFRSRPEMREVILSGGDPLTLSENQLEYLISSLRKINHINQIRIHTRYPVTMPMRITDELCDILKKNFPIYVVTHFNHVKECTEEAANGIKMLIQKGNAIVLNQSVLLKGINDTPKDLTDLNYKLVSMGVKPYYLHQCDEVWGSSHFRVPIVRGMEIMKQIRGKISGIAMPQYVVDLTNGGGKVPLVSDYMSEKKEESYIFSNYNGDHFEVGF